MAVRLARLPLASLFAVAAYTAVFADDGSFFESRIRPVLIEHCYECHSGSADVVQAGLRLDNPSEMREGGDSGAVIVPGQPEESLLISALRYDSSEMPPSGPLDERVIRDFETWINNGAVDPRETAPTQTPASDAENFDWQAAQEFWAFQQPRFETPPSASASTSGLWSQNWIDPFILAKLEAAGLTPNKTADRRTLIRRLTFDLTGLPPRAGQVDAFLNDEHPGATATLVDRLLASPAYAEHWSRLWLDVARYAEDQAHKVGNNDSLTYPNAYLYRDWVIEALASDMPYDEFVRLQLAADQIAPEDTDVHRALGFLGLGPKYYRRNSPEVMADEWEDRIDTVSRGLLGLTVACARCHDHKYDPIPTEDYYALAGVFASTEMFNRPLDDSVETKKGQAAKPQDAVHIVREGDPRDLHVMVRGDANRKGELVERRFLTVLSTDEPEELDDGSGRVELANAIVDPTNPLTARVFVNRVWRKLMGRGLVETPSNFGSLGETPSHPELLDALAVRFMQKNWSLKWLVREIVLSATYRQDGTASQQKLTADPENRLYGRMPPKRLSIEGYRDAVLAVSGRLQRSIGGRSVQPDEPDSRRRTVYSRISRLDLNPLLARFDFPDPNAHSAKRVETTTPLQKLFLLNSPFVIRQAESLADKLIEHNSAADERIDFAYLRLFARKPTAEEQQWALDFVASDSREGWVQYAQMLLISNEMLFVD